jgi:hypothetical protein
LVDSSGQIRRDLFDLGIYEAVITAWPQLAILEVGEFGRLIRRRLEDEVNT